MALNFLLRLNTYTVPKSDKHILSIITQMFYITNSFILFIIYESSLLAAFQKP